MSTGQPEDPPVYQTQVDIGAPIYVYDCITGAFLYKGFESNVADIAGNPSLGWTPDAPAHNPAVVYSRFDQYKRQWEYSDFSIRPKPNYDPFVWEFTVSDWALYGTYYYLSILASEHGCGLYPTVIVLRNISTNGDVMYRQENAYPNAMKLEIIYVEAGRIILKVPQKVYCFDGVVVVKI